MAVCWNVEEILQSSRVAVVILNQPILCPPEVLLPIWNRGVCRVTVDGGSNRWRSYEERVAPGLSAVPSPPHCVTGDLDSITPEAKADLLKRGVALIPSPDQNETDFTKALRIVDERLRESGESIDYIVSVCEHAGRLDQTLANLETLYHAAGWGAQWRPVILAENSLTWLLPAGRHIIHVPPLCVTASLPCGLIPLSGPTTVSTKGLKWDLDKGLLSFGHLVSTSNTFLATKVEVETSQNLVWTMQFLQDSS